MTYAIDTDGTRVLGSTLFTSHEVLWEGSHTAARAGRRVMHALGGEDPLLAQGVAAFLSAHVSVIETTATASAALARRLTWVAQSTHELEVGTAADLGSSGQAVP